MASDLPSSVPGVADVEVVRGPEAGTRAPALLVEVPHGAERADYDALRAALAGRLPADLHEFFSVNTDVGAWPLGRRVAEAIVAADPRRSAIAIRCRIPRTFIDCNRIEGATEGDLRAGGMTASVPAYVKDDGDRARLLSLHRRYVALVEEAHAALDPGGFLLLPHTYGPRTLGIDAVGDDIVAELRRAHEPERVETWPLRPEVDLITRSQDGAITAALDVAEEVAAGFGALGVAVAENATYHLHPSTLAHRWAARFPGRVFCLEVRRDLLVRSWTWNGENQVVAGAIERFAAPIAASIDRWLRRSYPSDPTGRSGAPG
ncbi:MAG TPA: hypothetical protein VKB80_13820 [Kofleriaceae bacterium]|nr:hypothetical protein [Kofleriaceae bacterium]